MGLYEEWYFGGTERSHCEPHSLQEEKKLTKNHNCEDCLFFFGDFVFCNHVAFDTKNL